MIRSTSPAKILPKSRNDKEIIFEISPMISSMPVKKAIGPLNVMNLPRWCLAPTVMSP